MLPAPSRGRPRSWATYSVPYLMTNGTASASGAAVSRAPFGFSPSAPFTKVITTCSTSAVPCVPLAVASNRVGVIGGHLQLLDHDAPTEGAASHRAQRSVLVARH